MEDSKKLHRIHWFLFLIIFATPIIKSVNLPFVGERLALFEVIFVLAIPLFIVYLINEQEYKLYFPVELLPLSILVFSASIALYNTYSLRLGLLNLIVLIYYILLTILLIQLLRDTKTLHYAINTYVLTSVLVLITGFIGLIALFFGVPNPFVHPIAERVIATFREPNQVPAFLVTSFPLFVLHPARRRSTIQRIVFAVCALATVAVVIGTGSDWGLAIILFEVGLIVLYKLYSTDYFTEAVYLGLGVVILVFGVGVLIGTGQVKIPHGVRSSFSLFMLESYSLKNIIGAPRYMQFIIGFPEAIERHPFVGIGLGTFGSFMGENFGQGGSMHNTYLGVLVGTGLIGGIAFSTFLILIVKKALYSLTNPINCYWKELTASLVVGLIGLLVYQLAHYGLRWRQLWVMFGFIIALAYINQKEIYDPK